MNFQALRKQDTFHSHLNDHKHKQEATQIPPGEPGQVEVAIRFNDDKIYSSILCL